MFYTITPFYRWGKKTQRDSMQTGYLICGAQYKMKMWGFFLNNYKNFKAATTEQWAKHKALCAQNPVWRCRLHAREARPGAMTAPGSYSKKGSWQKSDGSHSNWGSGCHGGFSSWGPWVTTLSRAPHTAESEISCYLKLRDCLLLKHNVAHTKAQNTLIALKLES